MTNWSSLSPVAFVWADAEPATSVTIAAARKSFEETAIRITPTPIQQESDHSKLTGHDRPLALDALRSRYTSGPVWQSHVRRGRRGGVRSGRQRGIWPKGEGAFSHRRVPRGTVNGTAEAGSIQRRSFGRRRSRSGVLQPPHWIRRRSAAEG